MRPRAARHRPRSLFCQPRDWEGCRLRAQTGRATPCPREYQRRRGSRCGPSATHRMMCVFVIAVNWQIRAATRKTRPRAISLKCRNSRPLAANANMTRAAIIRISAATSILYSSAPDIRPVAVLGLHPRHVGFGPSSRQLALLGEGIDEGSPDIVPHRLRPTDVDIGTFLNECPDQCPLLDDAMLHILALAWYLARHGDVQVVKNSLRHELLDLLAIDVVELAGPNTVEEHGRTQRDAGAFHGQALPEKGVHGRVAGAGRNEDHRLGHVFLEVEALRSIQEHVHAIALTQTVDVVRTHPGKDAPLNAGNRSDMGTDRNVRHGIAVDARTRARGVVARPEWLRHLQEIENVDRAGLKFVE